MLSAGIAALGRAERCRALAPLRLARPAPVAVRWHSATTPSNHDDDGRGVRTPDDTFASAVEPLQGEEIGKDSHEQWPGRQPPEPLYTSTPKNQSGTPLQTSQHGKDTHTLALLAARWAEEARLSTSKDTAAPNGVFDSREPKPRTKPSESRRAVPDASPDVFTKVLVRGAQAEVARLSTSKDAAPSGVFDRREPKPRTKPLETQRSASDANSDIFTKVLVRGTQAEEERLLMFTDASPDGAFDRREPKSRTKPSENRRSVPDAGHDIFSKVLAQGTQAEEARLLMSMDTTPNGVFDRVEPTPGTTPFENRRSAPDAGSNIITKVLVAGQHEETVRSTWGRPPGDNPRESGAESLESTHEDFRNQRVEFPVLEVPKDPSQLEALPKGFHNMTFEEQQEELWIVHAESRLGREWEMADSGKHRPYNNDYPPYSPSKVLGMLYRWRSRAWTAHEWRLARAIAGNRSLRLPVLATQAWLRRHALLARRRGVTLKIERYLSDTEEWKANLADLERQTGITEADIKQWLWILYPVSGDAKLQRFIKSDCRKPLFLLTLLLAKDKTIQEPATFVALLKYIKDNYVLAERPPDEGSHPAYQGQGRSMTWWHYLVFLYRLVWHCREGWPAAMPLLARLTADYIGTMRLEGGGKAMTGYQARSLVLNKALQYFSWPARVRPLDHMEHNWAAQRHLLRLAAAADPPLVMDQNGYRSVRKVLIALSKTKGEAKNADWTSKTWPPYRRTFDGVDERRHPEDDLSRSAKAGLLVREAGYGDDIVDRALSALGGSTFGQSPTIQTRSLPPPFFSGQLASHNIYSEWAAQVRATRNAREAWMVFENPPEAEIRPNLQVYAEMFDKLYARPVSGSSAIRPGDAKEAFPVHDANLSEFEIARLTPPSPDELYDAMMLHDKLVPSGSCLAVLVRNAPSKTAALRYLGDSPYEPYIKALRERVSWEDGENLKALSRIPLSVFNAWIAMLCRLHTRNPREDSMMGEPLGKIEHLNPSAAASADASSPARQLPEEKSQSARGVSQGGLIREAIELATVFQAHNPKFAHRDAQPWHTIMGALAGSKVLYSRMGAAYNVIETLMAFLKLYQRTTLSKGIDPVCFETLCLMLRKTLRLATFEDRNGEVVPRDTISCCAEIEELVAMAHRFAVRAFKDLTRPVPGSVSSGSGGGPPVEMPRYNVLGRPLHRYMLALGCCGDQKEMVRVMDWILDGWDRDYIREEARAPHDLKYHYMMRTFGYFVKVGVDLVEPAEMERLETRLAQLRETKGCTWFWPTDSWANGPAEMIPEGDTDLVLLERWPRLRQMVNFGEPSAASAALLSELTAELPVTWEADSLAASDLA